MAFGSIAPELLATGTEGMPVADPTPEEQAALAATLGQTWPAKLVKDAAHAIQTVVDGGYQPGLRRTDVTDIPAPTGPTDDSTMVGKFFNLAPAAYEPNDKYIQASTDLAGLTGGSALPAVAARGVEGLARRPVFGSLAGAGAVAREAPAAASGPFYSAVERAVESSALKSAPGDQWAGTLRNAPGVKAEELQTLGLDKSLSGAAPVSKAELLEQIAERKVQLGEVEKGGAMPDFKGRALADIDRDMDRNLEALGDNSWDRRPDLQARHKELYTERQAAVDFRDKWQSERQDTKFSQWQLPGGENYRERVLTLPVGQGAKIEAVPRVGGGFTFQANGQAFGSMGHLEGMTQEMANGMAREQFPKSQMGRAPSESATFRSSHWDEPNVIGHYRANDRMLPDPVTGEPRRTLFLEELQSDWHQKGRKQGYQGLAATEAELAAARARFDAADQSKGKMGVPDAPFKKTWPDLLLKRAIREAADAGHDQIAWTPGHVQADRYDLSKHIDTVVYKDGNLTAIAKGGKHVVIDKRVAEANLAEHIGKEGAEKLLSQPWHNGGRSLGNADLKVGGEGMAGFYDQILPTTANKLFKKYGVQVKQTEMHGSQQVSPSHIEATAPPDKNSILREVMEIHENNFANALADTEHRIAEGSIYGQSEAAYAQKVHDDLLAWQKRAQEAAGGNKPIKAHVMTITPELREAAKKGFPLFSAGVPVGPLADKDRHDGR